MRYLVSTALMLGMLSISPPAYLNASAGEPEQVVKIEIKRIEESLRLLDRFAEQVWPGWDDYKQIAFHVVFPNKVRLSVNPGAGPEAGYRLLRGVDVLGSKVYIDSSRKTSTPVLPPMVTGRGKGGSTIYITLRKMDLPAEALERYKNAETVEIELNKRGNPIEPTPLSDSHILMYIHELFHGYQNRVAASSDIGAEWMKFPVTPVYAVYSSIEGMALGKAYAEKDDQAALGFLKDFLVARHLRYTLMPPIAVKGERRASLIEGTASYASLKTALLIMESGYTADLNRNLDPFFHNFKFVARYLEDLLVKLLDLVNALTFEKRGKCYLLGAYQCLLLDRFVSGWKKDFFKNNQSQEQVIGRFLKLTPWQECAIAAGLFTRYPFAELYDRHQAEIAKEYQ